MPAAWQGPGQHTPQQLTQEGTCPSLLAPLQEHPAPDQWGWVIKMELCLHHSVTAHTEASATPVDVFFPTCSRFQAHKGLSYASCLHPNGARAGDILLLLQQPTAMSLTPSHPHTHTPKCGQEEKVDQCKPLMESAGGRHYSGMSLQSCKSPFPTKFHSWNAMRKVIIQPPTAPNETNCNTPLFSLNHLRNKLGSVSAGIAINIPQKHNPALVTDDESAQLHSIFWKFCYRFFFFFFLQIPKDWMTQRLSPSSKSCSQRGLWQGRMEAAPAVAPQCSVQEGKADTWRFLHWHYSPKVKSYILRISRIKRKKK